MKNENLNFFIKIKKRKTIYPKENSCDEESYKKKDSPKKFKKVV